jgi:hypothetical protein
VTLRVAGSPTARRATGDETDGRIVVAAQLVRDYWHNVSCPPPAEAFTLFTHLCHRSVGCVGSLTVGSGPSPRSDDDLAHRSAEMDSKQFVH